MNIVVSLGVSEQKLPLRMSHSAHVGCIEALPQDVRVDDHPETEPEVDRPKRRSGVNSRSCLEVYSQLFFKSEQKSGT